MPSDCGCPASQVKRDSPPREGVQIAWIVGPRRSASFNAGEGNFCVRRPAAFGRPRTPSRRSYRAPPEVWLSPRALAPRAPSLMTDSLLSALVARNRWLLARPAACATGLTPPAGVRSSRAGCSGSLLERACRADRLVLGSSGSSRHWSRSALVSARPALVSARPVARATGLAPRWSPLVPRWSPLVPRWSPLVR